ncbi:DUF362 domain-containing protein [Caldithrix abyssi]|uniref:Uncharacterized conserved protein, DUF362 family n=1 Tax=Caldithrix abyssi DSM 13497 TaxID=880073 RepID=H1XUK6_CALAY|nr:DUF362 domain-containing protein [Caldithrix abyssi]APF16838.1 Uncharacterized conserved protein, DUF362 family [Caldithrix abyssi DSM 13497]EHO40505.1 protein of unknown function DUF362 [Caldithrix abyssi DSM 13497]
MNRRNFLKRGLIVSGAVWLSGKRAVRAASQKSKVIIAQNSKVLAQQQVRGDVLLSLLDNAMQSYFDCDHPVRAWQKVARTGEVIGLKINCLSGAGSTHHELVEAIVERLQQAGIKPYNIIIWDRLNKDLEDCKFKINYRGKGVKCFGNDAVGFYPELQVFGQAGSLVSRIVTDLCDGIINVALLRDHSIAGISVALKNMFGAIHNPNKYHLNAGNPFIADVNAFPMIRSKIRLHIVDALEGQYHGGPAFMPQWRWPFAGIMLSQDPVATDAVAWQIIEQKRKEKGLPPLKQENREPRYIFTAGDAEHRLGHFDKNKIETVHI